MAEQDTQTGQAIAVQPDTRPVPRPLPQVSNQIPMFDTDKFEHMARIAGAIARAPMLPDHLKARSVEETTGNCLLIVNKALTWNMDPFDVMMSTSLVHGKLCYEGKLIAAVLEANYGIVLDPEWNEESGDAFGILVTGPRPSDGKMVSVRGTVGDWKTTDKQGNTLRQWKGGNARDQLFYRATRQWARLYHPTAILGMYGPEEIQDQTARRGQADAVATPADPLAITTAFPDGDPDEFQLEAEDATDQVDTDAMERAADSFDDYKEAVPGPSVAEELEPEPEVEPEVEAKPAAKSSPEPQEERQEETQADEPAEDPDAPAASGEAETDEPEQDEGSMDLAEETAAVEKVLAKARKAADWNALQKIMADTFKSAEFSALSATKSDVIRAVFYERSTEMDAPKLTEQPHLFRCWLAVAQDVDVVEDMFADLTTSGAYGKLSETARDALRNATTNRIRTLEDQSDG